MQKLYLPRPTVRRFIDAVEYVFSRNVVVLAMGRYVGEKSNIYRVELDRLAKTKRVEALRKIRSQAGDVVYTTPWSKRKTLGTHKLFHDKCLRDVLAKFMHARDYQDIDKLSISNDKNADAYFTGLYFEFDNGHMTERQLEDKIKSNYLDKGAYRVLFIMGSRYDESNQDKRLKLLFDIVNRVCSHKPGRIVGATYQGFMETGKVFNTKGEASLK